MGKSHYQVIVIGAGAAGLVVAIGAAKAKKKVLLIEQGHWGGDCTNFGCIPSKTLIAHAHLPSRAALEKVRAIIAKVRKHEEPDALAMHGVTTVQGTAQFIDKYTVEVNGENYSADKFVIAAGSRPRIPDIEWIEDVPYLTNETIFSLEEAPKQMIILGGGPIGCEMAQAFAHLGTKVSLVHSHEHLLNREELCAQKIIEKRFTHEGIDLYLKERPQKVSYDGTFKLQLEKGETLQADALLVSIGRESNCDTLNLNNTGVIFHTGKIPVDEYGRTNETHIFAIGDVTGPPFFTHRAEHEARAVLTSLILPINKRIDKQAIPRVTFTTPEVASIGLSEYEAREKYRVAIYDIPLSEVDRAICEEKTEGFIRVITKKYSSRILGATIVAPRAGEMLMQLSLAMKEKIPLRRLASLIHPYPIYSQGIRKAADKWLLQTILRKK